MNMKKIQILRRVSQILFMGLATVSLIADPRAFMVVLLVITVLCGPFYCGWICPYGFFQDLFGKAGDMLGIKKKKMPAHIQRVAVFSRYALLALVLITASDIVFQILSLDPRVNFLNILGRNAVPLAAVGIIALFLLLSMLFERPFCNYLCYEGARYGLIGSFRLFTVKRNKSKCVNCKKCDKACPMNINVSKVKNVRSPQCINCFECVSTCPVDGALCFGKVAMDESEKKRYVVTACAAFVIAGAFAAYHFMSVDNELDSPQSSGTVAVDNEMDSPQSPGTVAVTSEAAGLDDGIYTGEGEGFRGTIVVEVAVKDQQIASIEVVTASDDKKWFDRANSKIPESIIDSQSTDVDTVSGSTYSSIGILDAVKDALQNAQK